MSDNTNIDNKPIKAVVWDIKGSSKQQCESDLFMQEVWSNYETVDD